MKNIFDYKDNLHMMDHIPAILKWGVLEGQKPDVSILMPVYNHPHFFKIALETALNQDYKGNYEIIVLDNNMDDDVDNVNEFETYVNERNDPKVLYYKNKKNIDGINSFNRLPQLARADFFIYLHDDDELAPNCISELLKIKKEKRITYELIVPSWSIINKESELIRKRKKFDGMDLWGRNYKMNMYDWFFMNYTNGCGALQSKKVFFELGGFCSDNIPSADYCLYTLYVAKYGGYYLNKKLWKYRLAENDLMKSYEGCLDVSERLMNDLIPYISLPKFFLWCVIKAKKRVRLERNDIDFRGGTNRPAKKTDVFVLRLATIVKFILHLC